MPLAIQQPFICLKASSIAPYNLSSPVPWIQHNNRINTKVVLFLLSNMVQACLFYVMLWIIISSCMSCTRTRWLPAMLKVNSCSFIIFLLFITAVCVHFPSTITKIARKIFVIIVFITTKKISSKL